MTTSLFKNGVELMFDNGKLEGYINVTVENAKSLLTVMAHDSNVPCEEAIPIIEVEDLELDKESMITFLEKTLELLKGER
ncbi:hypothetical protein KUA24_32 [Vibrio phage HNL01]|nr:hypothetical protein KUA24_32 [Vibrio phage HNL01]